VQGDIKVPGRQQEGVALGPDGSLWLADDQDKCVVRIDGALAVLEKLLQPAPPPSPRPSPVSLVG
jgi:streptogramin lyase